MTDTTSEVSRPKRQLVVCCDGTDNNLTGQARDTNVVKLVQLMSECDSDPNRIVFYDPGVGNPGELPGATWTEMIRREANRLGGLAFGRGVYQNMAECYLFLMRNYRPGDEIFVFGFSRGAFTARSVAGLINMFGVLQPHMETMVTTLIQIYFSDREKDKKKTALSGGKTPLEKISTQTSQLFAIASAQKTEIQFVGVWDTVDSVGMRPFQTKMTAKPTIQGKRFLNVRHAVALDEHRAQFKPRLYIDDNGEYLTNSGKTASIKQLWFRGAHCDVGGGYEYEKGETAISNRALEWIVSEAVLCGLTLRLNAQLLNTELLVRSAYSKHEPRPLPMRVHSELHVSCRWALTGMAVRQTNVVELDDDPKTYVLKPQPHASVTENILAFPADTAWLTRTASFALYVWLLIGCAAYVVMGGLLSGHAWPTALAGVPNFIWQCGVNSGQLAWLQLTWLWMGGMDALTAVFSPGYLRTVVLFDFVFIAAYAHVLSWFVVRAFAKKAGLRLTTSAPRPWLNRLGWALPVMVAADVLENLLTITAISLHLYSESAVTVIFGTAMSVASLGKWLGLAGVVALLLPSFLGSRPDR